MAKPGKSSPMLVSIAEKLGTTVGLIVAKTTGAVEGATKSFMPAENAIKSPKSKLAKPVKKTKPAGKRKAPVPKKKTKRAVATTRVRKARGSK